MGGGWEPKTLLDVLIHLEWEWDVQAWWPKGNSILELHKNDRSPGLAVVQDWSVFEEDGGVAHYGVDDDALIDRLLQIGKGG